MNTLPRLRLMSLLLLALLLISGLIAPRQTQADTRVDVNIGVFYNSLAPYGNWVNHPTYGQVWYPRDVSRDWRPYTDGHWAHTQEYGWLWVSDHRWGWAPFHYGRWAWDDWHGWIWVPGYTWAPAWVFWRSGGGYAAWAPMPPNVIWQAGSGLNIRYFNYDRDLHRDAWVAVHDHDLPNPHIRHHIFAPVQNRQIINVTNNINNVTIINKTIVNPGIPAHHIEKITGRPVKSLKPVIREDLDDRYLATPDKTPGKMQSRQGEHRDDVLEIIRPNKIKVASPDDLQRSEELARRLDGKNAAGGRTTFLPSAINSENLRDNKPRVPQRLHEKPASTIVTPQPSNLPEGPGKQPSSVNADLPNEPKTPRLTSPLDAERENQASEINGVQQTKSHKPPRRSLPTRQEGSQLIEQKDLAPRSLQEPEQSNRVWEQSQQQQQEAARQQQQQRQQQQAERAREQSQQLQQQEAARQQQQQRQQQQAERVREQSQQLQQQEAARQQQQQRQQLQAERVREQSQQLQQQDAGKQPNNQHMQNRNQYLGSRFQ